MKFLADENFPRPAVRALREHGFEVAWATENIAGSADEDVLARCTDHKLTLMTLERTSANWCSEEACPLNAV
jgi:Domain of unknown function (DUF5615)